MPKKETKVERIINSDSFSILKEIIQITLPDDAQEIMTIIEHLIRNNSGNAYQLACKVLSELRTQDEYEKTLLP